MNHLNVILKEGKKLEDRYARIEMSVLKAEGVRSVNSVGTFMADLNVPARKRVIFM